MELLFDQFPKEESVFKEFNFYPALRTQLQQVDNFVSESLNDQFSKDLHGWISTSEILIENKEVRGERRSSSCEGSRPYSFTDIQSMSSGSAVAGIGESIIASFDPEKTMQVCDGRLELFQ